MKNQLCFTITHVKGSHQLALSKSTIKVTLCLIVLTLIALTAYPIFLSLFNQKLEVQNAQLLANKLVLQQQTEQLQQRHKQLTEQYQSQQAALSFSHQQLDNLVQQLNVSGEAVFADFDRFQQVSNELAFKQLVLQSIPNGRPLDYIRVTSSFGGRHHPFHKKNMPHRGIDVQARIGTPVMATADGVVSDIQNTRSGFGKLVKISHAMGFQTYYGHLDSFEVKRGQVVSKGELIAYSGNSGMSTGPHLHYEVRYGEKPLDPAHFILWTLHNFDTQLEKIREIPWDSLMVSLQRRMVVQPLPSSPLIAELTVNSISTADCMLTATCLDTSNVLAQSPLGNPVILTAK